MGLTRLLGLLEPLNGQLAVLSALCHLVTMVTLWPLGSVPDLHALAALQCIHLHLHIMI